MWWQNEPRAPPQGRLLLVLQANAYSPASTDETYTRSMSEPLDTTPCRRPSASSTNGTLASLRGRAGGITRAVLDFSQSANGASPSPRRTAAPQWRDAAEHTRDHRQDDDADVELTIDPSSHAGPGSRPRPAVRRDTGSAATEPAVPAQHTNWWSWGHLPSATG